MSDAITLDVLSSFPMQLDVGDADPIARQEIAALAGRVTTVEGDVDALDARVEAIEADGSVTPAKLADGAVTTPKLADGAVTDAKLVQTGGVLDKVSMVVQDKMVPLLLDPQSGAYPITTKEYWYNTGFYCIVIEASENDVIRVSARSAQNVPIAVFYSGVPSASNYLGYHGSATEEVIYTNELLSIPSGTTHIAINNRYGGFTFAVTKQESEVNPSLLPVYAKYDGTTVTFGSRYTESSNIYITMKKRGGNNLFDFDKITELFDDGTSKVLMSNVTDFFSPYRLRAVDNADGDMPDGWYYHFVGGNHQYNNGSSGSTATARCTIDAVLFDNELVTNDTRSCQKVDIYWTNYIQGQNTKKADGTGREILKEKYHLTYDGDKLHINHVFTPLENVLISVYYGLSVFWYNANGYYYELVGGETRSKQTAPVAVDSGNTKCRSFIVSDADGNKVTAKIEDIDLGDWSMAEDSGHSVFSTTDRKVYFNLINLNSMTQFDADCSYYYDGSLQFEKMH